ncbi:hypothetical protein SAMN02910314_01771 [Denitrobacterium detoxificans]|uniref:Uncharacterized protein n=1 Tax=Denitrobacterium detoxificans TaxID=79604 RepID=A0A1H8U1X2_9ACTN|nr:hypothetical protein SAMN02910314_01771 [Denitrobacterium detoxificans]
MRPMRGEREAKPHANPRLTENSAFRPEGETAGRQPTIDPNQPACKYRGTMGTHDPGEPHAGDPQRQRWHGPPRRANAQPTQAGPRVPEEAL